MSPTLMIIILMFRAFGAQGGVSTAIHEISFLSMDACEAAKHKIYMQVAPQAEQPPASIWSNTTSDPKLIVTCNERK